MSIQNLTDEQIKARIKALADYRLSMLRICEDSEAADREFERVMRAYRPLVSELKRRGIS